ncbi:hypothetical protein D3C87_1142540 [compost metagenome]
MLAGLGFLDIACLEFVHAGVLARGIADVPPGHGAGDDGAHARHDEGQAPGVERGNQPGDDDRAQCRAKRRAAIEQRGATAAFVLRHPDGVELAACRIDRRFGGTEAQAGQHQRRGAGAHGGQGLEGTPEHGGAGNHDARLVFVGQHAARHLHQGVGPEERTEDQALHGGAEIKLLRDQRHGHGQRRAVDVVDRDQEQHHQEDLPADGAARGRHRGGLARGWHDGGLLAPWVLRCRGVSVRGVAQLDGV